MSLQSRLNSLISAIGADVKSIETSRNIPSYAPSGLENRFDPITSAYNAKSGTLRGPRAKLAKVVTGEADFHILFVGDSSFGGYDGSTYRFEDCVPRSTGKVLANAVGANFMGGLQFGVADVANGHAENITVGAGWTVFYQFIYSTGTGGGDLVWTTPEACDTVELYVWNTSTTAVPWKIDGVAQTAITTDGSGTIKKTTVAGLSQTVHTISLTSTASHNTYVVGWRGYNSSKKAIHIHNISLGGSKANSSSASVNWSNTTSTIGAMGLGYVNPQFVTASGITPDLVIISIGGNDASSSIDAATILTGVDNIRSYWSTTPVLLLHCYKPSSGVSDTIWDAFTAGLYTKADSEDCLLLDWDDLVGRYAGANANGIIGADGTHPTLGHQKMIGRHLANLIATAPERQPEIVVVPSGAGGYASMPDGTVWIEYTP